MVSKIGGVLLFSCAVSNASHYNTQWQAALQDQPDTTYNYLCGLDSTEIDNFLKHILQNLRTQEAFQVCVLILSSQSFRNGSPRLRMIGYAKEQLIFHLQTTPEGTSILKKIITQYPSTADLISSLSDN